MDDRQCHSYSWHQSHDQATVLLVVPYETTEEDVVVVFDQNHLIAGVRDQPPIVKGRLYGNVDNSSSLWQLEPRASRYPLRERTISTTSTASTQFSYALVSEPDISSSFAASLEGGEHSNGSEADEPITPSPAFSSPYATPAEERTPFPTTSQQPQFTLLTPTSHPTSPRASSSWTSSFSSVESLHSSRSGRLLTLHLEKSETIMWPCLIVGPAPESLAPCAPGPPGSDPSAEFRYNMDPTSLGLIAIDLLDIRKDKQEAFECFIRAWHQAHASLVTLRLVTRYLPLQAFVDRTRSPGLGPPERDTHSYYLQSIGGPSGLAQLYLEAGLLHLEGSASTLLSSSAHLSLSSIRAPGVDPASSSVEKDSGSELSWRRDREAARRYFDRARSLAPHMDIPLLPSDSEDPHRRSGSGSGSGELKMPQVELSSRSSSGPASVDSHRAHRERSDDLPAQPRRRKRREETEASILEQRRRGETDGDGWDSAWYLYLPGLVGAGTALLVVGVVGGLSLSSWRKNQGS